MQVKYGTYTHDSNEVEVTISRQHIYGDSGVRTGYREEWRLRGLLYAATQSALTTAIGLLDTAYLTEGQNLILYENDGTTVARQLTSSAADGGVMILEGPNYPEGGRTDNEYGNYRTYEIVAAAEFTGDNAGETLPDDVLIWTETLTITGTGESQFVLVPILNGKWPVQRLRAATSVHAVQQGQAIGRKGFPSVPKPIFPGWEHKEQRVISKGPIKRTGPAGSPQYVEWPISWTYNFESPSKLSGNPGKPPA